MQSVKGACGVDWILLLEIVIKLSDRDVLKG